MRDKADLEKLIESKSKKKINSKGKGGRFERKISDLLNRVFNTTDFCRTPGSGAFATTHKLPTHMQVHGDLITPLNFKFTIECKSGYNKESLDSVFNPKSILISMIEQSIRDSIKSKKDFILIIGQDRKIPLAIIE
jgi:hypothetical protein